MVILELKKELIKRPEDIKKILEYFGFSNIRIINSKEIRFARDSEGNTTSLRIRLDNNEKIFVNDFAKSSNMDLISMIIKEKKVEYWDVINCIKSVLGVDLYSLKTPTKRSPFGGIYDNFKSKNHNTKVITYDISTMDNYIFKPNLRFIKDGISIETQRKFNIRFDVESQRIIIPIYDCYYNILGYKGRLNYDILDDTQLKYVYMMPTQKHLTMFGYCQNYKNMYGGTVIIGESEKFSLQGDSYEYKNCMGIGGNSLTEEQCKIIFSLDPEEIILMFDEGLEEKVVMYNIDLLKRYNVMRDTRIKLWDSKNSKYIDKGSKMSATDKGKMIFDNILKEEIIYV